MELPGYLHPSRAGQSCQTVHTLLLGICHSSPSDQLQGTYKESKKAYPLPLSFTASLLHSLLLLHFYLEGSSASVKMVCSSVTTLSAHLWPSPVLEAPSWIFLQGEKSTYFPEHSLLFAFLCIAKSFPPFTSPTCPCWLCWGQKHKCLPRALLCPVYFFCSPPPNTTGGWALNTCYCTQCPSSWRVRTLSQQNNSKTAVC